MNDQPLSELSKPGLARRERMHDELIAAMRTLHRRRRVRRRAVVAAVVLMPLLLGGYVWLVPFTSTPPAPGFVKDSVPPQPSNDIRALSIVRIVRTDPSILDRYVIAAPSPQVEILDDQRLVRELVALGRPAGVVRMEGRVWLTTDVTDDAQENPDAAEVPSSSTGSLPDRAGPWRSVDARSVATVPCQS